jgi:hypothetical protein
VLQQGLGLGLQGPTLFVNGGERAGQGRDHDVERAGARDHDGLLVERVEDLVDHMSAGAAADRALARRALRIF